MNNDALAAPHGRYISRIRQNRIRPPSSSSSSSQLQMINNSNPPPPFPPVRIAVMGGGNFGLALATVAARKNIPTTLLVRDQADADSINQHHRHPRKMNDFELPFLVRASTDAAECLGDATYIVHAVPVQYSRKFLQSVAQYIPANTPVISGSKGIETSSLGFMADILKECLGEDRSYAFLSGPSFAREICEGVATAVVIASEDLIFAKDMAELLSDESFRVFTSRDVVGVEIGGAVKNVIALAAGMCEGLGLGTNAMSGLVTRGCGEMRRLGKAFGARTSTLAGLSGKVILYGPLYCFLGLIQCATHSFIPLLFFIRRGRYVRHLLWSIVPQPKVWLPVGTG
jgi:glycerol-3-phosphate dehydrogenase (NAD+)